MIYIGKTQLTKDLELAIWNTTHKMGVFGCFEVTIGWAGKERVDYMTYDTKDIFRCYEIKVSEQDFKSNAALSFIGNYNYYVLTRELYNIVWDRIPPEIGVYIFVKYGENSAYCECIKKAKKIDLKVDKNILKNSLIRSLSREQSKVIENKNPLLLEVEKLTSRSLEQKNKKLVRDYNDLLLFVYEKFGFEWQGEFDDFIYSTTISSREKERKALQLKQFNKARELRDVMPNGADISEEIYALKTRFLI